MANVFEEKFGFSEVQALRVNELRVGIRKLLALAHFEEAVDDEDEFLEIGGKSSARDIFLPLATDFLTEALALEQVFLSLIKRCCAIFINGSRNLSAMPVFNLVSTLLI